MAVICWIPFYKRLADLPASHHYRASLATQLLFNSGNSLPPEKFKSYKDFAEWVNGRSKEYRAAVCFRDVRLSYDDSDSAPELLARVEGFTGFTSLKLHLAGVTLTLPRKLRYVKGLSDFSRPRRSLLLDNRGATLSFQYNFKLSHMMDMLQRSLTGNWAPQAWVAIDYEIRKTGRIRILTRGTAIPSSQVYIDWVRDDLYTHDMMQNDKFKIEGFMNGTRGCENAPEVSRHLFERSAVEVV